MIDDEVRGPVPGLMARVQEVAPTGVGGNPVASAATLGQKSALVFVGEKG